MFCGERVVWHRPTTLPELLNLKSQYPDAKLVIGNTEVGKEEGFLLCFEEIIESGEQKYVTLLRYTLILNRKNLSCHELHVFHVFRCHQL